MAGAVAGAVAAVTKSSETAQSQNAPHGVAATVTVDSEPPHNVQLQTTHVPEAASAPLSADSHTETQEQQLAPAPIYEECGTGAS